MKKAVLFDLDNTLYLYEPVHKKALNQVYKVFNKSHKISKENFFNLYKLSNQEIKKELEGTASAHNRVLYFQRLIEKTHNTIDPSLVLNLYKTYWNNFLKYMELRKSTLETLKTIKKMGLKIAIVSDLTTLIQLRKLRKLKISKYIDCLITSEEAGSEKPHSIMFLATLNKLNLLPENVIMVGDSEVMDIQGANAVKIDTVHIGPKFKRTGKEDYRKPNYNIKNLKEIITILKKKPK